MCDCLKKSEEKVTEHLTETLKERGIDIVEIDKSESGYANKGLSLGKNGGWKLFLPFELKYTPRKKDGSEGKEKTHKASMYPPFCPFCGNKMEELTED